MKDFGDILAEELHKRGITPTALGRAVDISPSGMSNYKKGRIPKSDELLRIAEFLGVTMEYLLTGRTSVSEPKSASAEIRVGIPDPVELDAVIKQLELNLRTLQRFRDSFGEDINGEKSNRQTDNVVPLRLLDDIVESTPKSTLPFYGNVAAGKPSDVDYYSDETYEIPGTYRPGEHYLLRVRGQSMEPDFPEGSYVLVRNLAPGEYARKGDVVIASDASGPTMKRLEYRKDGKKSDIPRKPTAHLVSINPEYDEIIPAADAPIQGVVIDTFPPDFFDA